MAKKKKSEKEYRIYEKCPLCSSKLKPILDKDGLVIDYWCNNCGIPFTIDQLEIREYNPQKKLLDFLK